MKSGLVIALFIGSLSIQQYASAVQIRAKADELDEFMEDAITNGLKFSKKKVLPDEDKTEEQLVQEACDVKLDSSVYTSESYLPNWRAPYSQATNTGKPSADDVEYGAPGAKALLSGTSTEEINKVLDSQGGDASFGVKENVTIGKYKFSDEIKDFSTQEWAKPSTSDSAPEEDCEERSPQEEAAFKAAYKTAYAAARGGASEKDAKTAAYSAVYGTGQGNQKGYEYNSGCKDCGSTLDGAEYETGDMGIQQRSSKKKKSKSFLQIDSEMSDDTYLEQADDILSETLDKDLNNYQKKQAQKAKVQKEEEAESELVFDQAIDSIPKGRKPAGTSFAQLEAEEDQQLVDLFQDPANANLLQLNQQVTVDESSQQEQKAYAYSQTELDENKTCESVYTDVTDE